MLNPRHFRVPWDLAHWFNQSTLGQCLSPHNPRKKIAGLKRKSFVIVGKKWSRPKPLPDLWGLRVHKRGLYVSDALAVALVEDKIYFFCYSHAFLVVDEGFNYS